MRHKCDCGEPIVKAAREPHGVVLLGTVVAYVGGRVTVECRKCHKLHEVADLLARKPGMILPPRLDR